MNNSCHHHLIFFFIYFACSLNTACAELRKWHDKNGNTLVAEYKGIFGNQVTLQNSKRKTLKVPIEKLSELDRSYIASKNPPVLDLKFQKSPTKSEKTPIEVMSDGNGKYRVQNTYTYSVALNYDKKSKYLYHELKANAYLFSSCGRGDLKLNSVLVKELIINDENEKGSLLLELGNSTFENNLYISTTFIPPSDRNNACEHTGSKSTCFNCMGKRSQKDSGYYSDYFLTITDSSGTIVAIRKGPKLKKFNGEIGAVKVGDIIEL
jgi:hypothetical protein